jgi:ATP-dependent exoDNAse (exonuclease V) beta subunit
LKVWSECAYKHKLRYIDEIAGFTGNEYTAFGTAIHTVCESLINKVCDDYELEFREEFEKEISALDGHSDELSLAMVEQGPLILKEVMNGVTDAFGEYEVISTEEELYEPIGLEGAKKNNFKGFIDLVLKVGDTYHVIDWKTCSWGWNMKKKSDPAVVYQLMLYKKFYSQKHDIPLDKIKTHFALLKRTAKKDRVEIFELTSGHKRISNATELLHRAILNVEKKMFIKNRTSCKNCEFYKTEHCK